MRAKKYFSDSRHTIIRWLDEIIAYFDNMSISRGVEGIKNKLQFIKRSGYGLKNLKKYSR
ncbi:transposase [Microcoleus sp. Pol12A5]|uniref:transposase n=1 Tax=Microcoleus sp. Pol12A5 TaxID=3055392 RepID=UPI0040409857